MTDYLPEDFKDMCLRCFHYAGPGVTHSNERCDRGRDAGIFLDEEVLELTVFIHPSWFRL